MDALVAEHHEIVVVVTQEPSRRRRGAPPEPTAVGLRAEELGIPVVSDPNEVLSYGPELGVVLAYGKILRRPLIDALELVNLHLSLLPRWRGAAPVQRAILEGDLVTGACLMRIEEGLDSGPVYGCRQVEIQKEETSAQLTARLVAEGTDLLLEKLASAGLGEPIAQQGEPTYAKKLARDELELSWDRDALYLSRLVRVGRAWTTLGGKRLLIHRARPVPEGNGGGPPGTVTKTFVATGDGCLELLEVQPEGRGIVSAGEWLRGLRRDAGIVLGS